LRPGPGAKGLCYLDFVDLERPIALVGIMGAGKSAVARILGERMGTLVADLDAMIEAEEGVSVAELFERAGEPYFRRRESELLARALAAGARVLACGGGIVLDSARRELLRARCHVVWLEVAPAEAARRAGGSPGQRPLLEGGAPAQRLAALLAARAPLYAEVASARVATDGRSPGQVADSVLATLGRTPGAAAT
jgi:shikimate kinase